MRNSRHIPRSVHQENNFRTRDTAQRRTTSQPGIITNNYKGKISQGVNEFPGYLFWMCNEEQVDVIRAPVIQRV